MDNNDIAYAVKQFQKQKFLMSILWLLWIEIIPMKFLRVYSLIYIVMDSN